MNENAPRLDDCGCCAAAPGPVPRTNPPGRERVDYRLDTHAGFKAALVSALAREPRLAALTTRAEDDPAIALLDGWAGVLDVLTFHTERIANEGWLRTATERGSILELARAIGYELRPGVAASAMLAFTLDPTVPSQPGVAPEPRTARIPAGTRAQTIPGQDERPQTFETSEDLEARAEWNLVRPRRRRRRAPRPGATEMALQGTETQLRAGDVVLFVGAARETQASSGAWDVRTVTSVQPHFESDPARSYTIVRWHGPLSGVPADGPAPRVHALRQRAALFGHNAPRWDTLPVALRVGETNPAESAVRKVADALETDRVRRAAPVAEDIASSVTAAEVAQDIGQWITGGQRFLAGPFAGLRDQWAEAVFAAVAEFELPLDQTYPAVVPGGWLVLRSASAAALFRIQEVHEATRTEFGVTAKATIVRVSGSGAEGFNRRNATVLVVSEELALAEEPIPEPVSGAVVPLEAALTPLPAGRRMIFAGPTTGGAFRSERVTVVHSAVAGDGRVTITLAAALGAAYARESLVILGNVVPATHGETRNEVLGAGDASRPFQTFALRQKPLTFAPVAVGDGAASTLEVRVNDLLWEERPSLFGLAPEDRCYTTRRADDGTVEVRFGDGATGTRLPSGQENVRARYRVGIGRVGMARAGQISLLLDRPLGVKEVVNPLPAEGAGDPEALADARRNAPRSVLTLGRVVSLRDYEDYARGFAGVGKAQATWVWSGSRRVVALTVLGEGGTVLTADGILANLRGALEGVREPHQPLVILGGVRRLFRVRGRLLTRPEFEREKVLAAAGDVLAVRFGFGAREFGQALDASEVMAVVQGVAGVEAVDLDGLEAGGTSVAGPGRLPARAAWYDPAAGVRPAELLEIDPAGVDWEEMPR